MAVEIKEIVIKAVLTPKGGNPQTASPAPVDPNELVQQCVDQVLKVLEKKTRR
jgi:hypothetical protein